MRSVQKEEDTLAHIVELSLLYDFYGALLKENKREIFEDYVLNDYSLGEISKERGISRQGVYDTVKRCTKELTQYEEKLNLIEKFAKIKKDVGRIHYLLEEIQKDSLISDDSKKNLDVITKIADGIMDNI
ncbi:MAG: DNA-binding protein [Lachnospiraceae bacterium]|nr:DNA-binding protein [Lachnospiraceae bacterium]